MEQRQTTEGKFSERLSHYDTEEGLDLLRQLADQRGVSGTALLRLLVREEAKRRGVKARP